VALLCAWFLSSSNGILIYACILIGHYLVGMLFYHWHLKTCYIISRGILQPSFWSVLMQHLVQWGPDVPCHIITQMNSDNSNMVPMTSCNWQWLEQKWTSRLTNKEKPEVMMYDKWIGANKTLNLKYTSKENLVKLKSLLLGFNFKMIAPEG